MKCRFCKKWYQKEKQRQEHMKEEHNYGKTHKTIP